MRRACSAAGATLLIVTLFRERPNEGGGHCEDETVKDMCDEIRQWHKRNPRRHCRFSYGSTNKSIAIQIAIPAMIPAHSAASVDVLREINRAQRLAQILMTRSRPLASFVFAILLESAARPQGLEQ